MNGSVSRRGGTFRDARGALGVSLLVVSFAGCVTRQAGPPVRGQAPAAARLGPSPRLGQAFEVVPARSSLTVLVYRAGPLAALGHDHIVACRCLTGTIYVPREPLHASFELHVAIEGLTVDDPALRAAEHSADFPPDVPPSARQGTRQHMLGVTQLNAVEYPDITLRSAALRPSPDGRRGDIVADVLVGLGGERRSISVPMHYELQPDEIVTTGEFSLKQTDLGLTPYSAAGGALRVANGMRVRIRLVAKRRP